MTRRLAWIAAWGLIAGVPGVAWAQGPIADPIVKDGTTIELETVASGLDQPNYLTHAGDGSGRRFALERSGRVRLFDGGGLVSTPFLDIMDRVVLGSERGLFGLAFHPGFDDPTSAGYGKFYTLASEAPSGTPDFAVPVGDPADHHDVLMEWSVSATDPNRADLASGREVLRIAKPQGFHNGGGIAFSPIDGLLHLGIGDGGGANDRGPGHSLPDGNGQDATNVLGDFLRIDPLAPSATPGSADPISANGQYRIPATNPFVGPGGGVDEIFAKGFRNPYRFSFDAETGDLIAGDVGQNSVEEVDIVTLGGNYGWRFKEGSFQFNPNTGRVFDGPDPIPGLIDPVLEYDHDEGVSIIGGFVYRGSALPDLVGDYIFGDLTGRLFRGDLAGGTITELTIGLDDRGLGAGRSIIGFGEDQDRELYVMTTDFTSTGGLILRIVPTAIPEPSTAALLLLAGGLIVAARRARRFAQ